MANRRDFYYRQKVTEAELDAAFEELEAADRALLTDLGIAGVAIGMEVVQAATPDMTVQVAGPGVAYDQDGQRIEFAATQSVNCAVDEDGLTTAVVAPGNSKILSIFIEFDRQLSDPRIDGNGATVFHVRDEHFAINVVQGVEGVSPAAPALRSDQILLADVTIAFGATTIVTADIATTRRQWTFKTTSGIVVAAGTLTEAIQAIANGAFPSAGGTVAGDVEITGEASIAGALEVGGNITLTGTSEVVYSAARSRQIIVDIYVGVPEIVGGVAGWQTQPAALMGWWATSGDKLLRVPLNAYLRDNMTITKIEASVFASTAQAVEADRVAMRIIRASTIWEAPVAPGRQNLGDTEDSGASGVQLLTLNPTIAVSRGTSELYLEFESSVAGGDAIYAVRLTVDDLGPLNH